MGEIRNPRQETHSQKIRRNQYKHAWWLGDLSTVMRHRNGVQNEHGHPNYHSYKDLQSFIWRVGRCLKHYRYQAIKICVVCGRSDIEMNSWPRKVETKSPLTHELCSGGCTHKDAYVGRDEGHTRLHIVHNSLAHLKKFNRHHTSVLRSVQCCRIKLHTLRGRRRHRDNHDCGGGEEGSQEVGILRTLQYVVIKSLQWTNHSLPLFTQIHLTLRAYRPFICAVLMSKLLGIHAKRVGISI